jgi:serine O-acetyltransferase
MKYSELKFQIRQDMLRLNSYAEGEFEPEEGLEKEGKKLSLFRRVNLILRPGLMALFLYRWSHFFYQKNKFWLSTFFYRLNIFLLSVDISPDSEIGEGCLMIHPVATFIHGTVGKRATFTARIIIIPEFSNNKWSGKPLIGDNVTIGAQSLIIGDIIIASDVTIAPNSHINKSITQDEC